MRAKIFILILSFLSSQSLWAITCYYTLVKDNCWLKYNVSVDIMEAASSNILATVTVPAGKAWIRQTFPCTAEEKLMYHARFSPEVWESDRGKTYMAKNYWSLPNEIKPGDSAWNVTVCFPSDFSEIPIPPTAGNQCDCDFNSIPGIPARKI